MAVERNDATHRFEIVDAPKAFLLFARGDGRIRLIHTEVPSALRGKGYASELARAALEYARDARLRVEAECPFVRAYLAKHPDLRSPAASDRSVRHHHSVAEERRNREAALDRTIAGSFPASDPPSSDPNPDEDDPSGESSAGDRTPRD